MAFSFSILVDNEKKVTFKEVSFQGKCKNIWTAESANLAVDQMPESSVK